MSHKCGTGCRRKQSPSQRKGCPSCGSSGLAKSGRYARKVINNPTRYYTETAKAKHPEVRPEWIERLTAPREVVRQADGRIRYDGPVPEMKNWLRVVVENDQLVTAFLIHSLRKKWGTP